MAKLFKRGNYWWTTIHPYKSKPKRVTTGHKKRQPAEQVARQLELENALPPAVRPWTIGQALVAAYELGELRENADSTLERYLDFGAHLIRILGGNTDTNAANLVRLGESYLKQRRTEWTRQGKLTSPHTIAKELQFLCMGLRHGKSTGDFHGEPKAVWPTVLKGYYTPGNRWLTREEFAALLRAEAASLKARPLTRIARYDWLMFYVNTGCSQGEIHKIKKSDVDLERRLVLIPGTKTKYRGREVPIMDDVMAVTLRRLQTPGPMLFAPSWHRSKMNANLKTWCEHAGIERCNATDLRRTYCSWMFSAGVPEIQVVKYMGHGNGAMVRRVYAQLSDGMHMDAIERFGSVQDLYTQKVTPIENARQNPPTLKAKGA